MNANRILMFWMYYIISIFVVVCLAFILKKVKIVRWQFFYPGQQEWAKRNEEKIDNTFEIVCQWMDKILIPKMNELCATE